MFKFSTKIQLCEFAGRLCSCVSARIFPTRGVALALPHLHNTSFNTKASSVCGTRACLKFSIFTVQRRRKDFLIGGAQYVINYFVVQNIYGTDWNLGGHVPRCPPGSYAYAVCRLTCNASCVSLSLVCQIRHKGYLFWPIYANMPKPDVNELLQQG